MQNQTKKILNYLSKLEEYPITILTLYSCTFFIYQDFGIRLISGMIILSILAIPIFIKSLKTDRNLISVQLLYLFLNIFILVSFLRPDSFKDKESIGFIIAMLISLGYILFAEISVKDVKISMKIFVFTALLFSFLIIFFQIFKDLYWMSIYPILSPTAKVLAKKYFFKGYSISFGGVAYTSYILILGLLTLLFYRINCNLNKIEKLIINILIGIMCFTFVMLGRRGELGALFVALIIYFVISAPKKKMLRRVFFVSLSLIIALGIIILLLPIISKSKILHRYTMTLNSILYGKNISGGISSGRNKLYAEAISIFKKNKILGAGWGSFANHGYVVLNKSKGEIRNVHNAILQLLAEVGIVGLFLYLLPIVYIFKATVVNMKLNLNHKTINYVAISVSVVFQIFIMIVSMVDPINYKIIFWILFSITLLYGFSGRETI